MICCLEPANFHLPFSATRLAWKLSKGGGVPSRSYATSNFINAGMYFISMSVVAQMLDLKRKYSVESALNSQFILNRRLTPKPLPTKAECHCYPNIIFDFICTICDR